jgi:hypothetical protein
MVAEHSSSIGHIFKAVIYRKQVLLLCRVKFTEQKINLFRLKVECNILQAANDRRSL